MGLKLKTCDIRACEALCCHDGVYLEPDEEATLKSIVEREPELRARLPEVYVVEGVWNGERLGRKTATRPHDYADPDFPAHFPRTRCVFADAAGLCELEKLARTRGEHPWEYKPFTCWMFPLEEDDGKALAPPLRPEDDPFRAEGYPGYVTRVPCGRHDESGQPWRTALERELRHFRKVRRPA